MSSGLVELLGEKLATGSGEVATAERLAGVEAVGLYFSAHWCGPCRGFTPKLAEAYKKYRDEKKLKFDVVFVSSDRDQASFDEYHGEMPWPALPFAERATKDKLSKKYKIQGIPSLVILDSEGKVITTDGREAVSTDPEGERFPWKPPTFTEALGDEFVDNKGNKKSYDDLKGKTLALYFSAHWCPPCKAFTPEFAETYKKVNANGHQLEVIFVSSDRDEASFNEYHAEMPWLALPFADRQRKAQLSSRYGVEGIPSLVILEHGGKVINGNGRGAVSGDKDGKEFPWYPKPVNDINSPDGINDLASLVVFMEGLSVEDQEKLTTETTGLAKSVLDGKDEPPFCFFTATKEGGVADRVRTLTKTEGKEKAKAILLDIPDSGAYYEFPSDKEISKENLAQFLKDYEAKTLDRKQLS